MRGDKGTLTPETRLTSAQAARLLGCNVSSIINWAAGDHIKCFTTPGGHRRFLVADVIAFIKDRGMPMPAELSAVMS